MFSSCKVHNNLSKVMILGEKCYTGKYGAVETSQSRGNRHAFILIEFDLGGGQWPQYYKGTSSTLSTVHSKNDLLSTCYMPNMLRSTCTPLFLTGTPEGEYA